MAQENDGSDSKDACPKCGEPLTEVITTKSGKKLRRCSTATWDPEEKKAGGCSYVKWLEDVPEELDEECPKCGEKLVLATTRRGKKLKKCSTNKWDREARKAVGCDYVEWINGTTEELDEDCPDCGEKLILYTTNSGKKMKRCSTAGWDREKRQPTGCRYVYWLRPHEYPGKEDSGGEEHLPPEPEE